MLGTAAIPRKAEVSLCPLLVEGKQFGFWCKTEMRQMPECIISRAQGSQSQAFHWFSGIFLPLGRALKNEVWTVSLAYWGVVCGLTENTVS